jgi:ABC-type uncharacterized transport system substrate-binding protein
LNVHASRFIFRALCLATGLVVGAPSTLAHPHVWVSVKATVLYENGTLTGLQQSWTFDEAYAAMAIEGLDTNGDGNYDRKELEELAKVNIDGLKEFSYFTFAKLGDGGLTFNEPTDYWLEYTGGVLTLHFKLLLEKPVLAETSGFTFSVYDPSFFIAFDLAKDNPVKLAASAPSGCKAEVVMPAKEGGDTQRLGEAFFQELGGGADYGIAMAKAIAVSCAKL